MDKKLRTEIIAEVNKAVTAAMLSVQEQYLTAEQLVEQFQMFTPDWVQKFGDILPRKKVSVTCLDGKKRGTRWGYARFQIAKNIADGLYDDMKLLR